MLCQEGKSYSDRSSYLKGLTILPFLRSSPRLIVIADKPSPYLDYAAKAYTLGKSDGERRGQISGKVE